jgi:hypothetical protein
MNTKSLMAARVVLAKRRRGNEYDQTEIVSPPVTEALYDNRESCLLVVIEM